MEARCIIRLGAAVSVDRGAANGVDKILPTNQPAFLMLMTLDSRKELSFDMDDERSITSTPHQASPGLPRRSQAQQCD